MKRRVIVVVLADIHSGSTFALMNPDTVIKQEGTNGQLIPYQPKLTEAQEYLWECYAAVKQQAKELAGKSEILLIVNGDSTQGIKHPTLLVSNRISDQIAIATYNLQPWLELKNLNTVKVVVGTGAHNFGEGSADVLIAEQLMKDYPHKSISNLYHGLLDINGFQIDYAHHGPYPGSRDWLRGNVAVLYLRDLMIRAIRRGERPPDVVLRAHYHVDVIAPTYVGDYFSQLIVSPSFSLLGDFAHQAARSPDTIRNGIFALEIVNGKLVGLHKFIRTLDIRTKESI